MKIIYLECLKRVEQIVGCKITNYKVDCLDLESLRDVFKKHSFYAIINFAALKSVGESVQKPVLYYKNNVGALINLLTVRFFFSFTLSIIIFSF
jgi:UDP-glucose 4-epimerase